MKSTRLALTAAAIALMGGGFAMAEDMDVRALQAKLAAQEAKLNDLQAKINSAETPKKANGITSIRKNAVVTVGGQVNTRYFARSGSIESNFARNPSFRNANSGADTALGRAQDRIDTRTDANAALNTPAGAPRGAIWIDPSNVGPGKDYAVNPLAGASGNATTPYLAGGMQKVADFKGGDLRVTDAKLEFKIDVNDYFDAYLKLDLHDTNNAEIDGIAQNYWIRWKNVCKSGFGLLIGRDAMKFAGISPYGALGGFVKKDGDEMNDMMGNNFGYLGMMGGDHGAWQNGTTPAGSDVGYLYAAGNSNVSGTGEGMFIHGWRGGNPTHFYWDNSRTTQINPYWETQDGKFKAEASFIQSVDTRGGVSGSSSYNDGNTREYRTINYGVGSLTARLTWKPIEGLDIRASFANLYAKNDENLWQWPYGRNNTSMTLIRPQVWVPGTNGIYGEGGRYVDAKTKNNNQAVNLSFQYRPCFFKKINVWGAYTKSWNDGWIDGLDNDSLSYGIGFDATDRLTFFAEGGHLWTKNDQGSIWHKANGWSAYGGVIYTLPYGVNLEAGYKHVEFKYQDRAGWKHTKVKGDTAYAHVGFNF